MADNEAFRNFRTTHRRWLDRVCIGALSPAEFMVYNAILSRTFGWGKFVEIIPLRHFREGMRDEDGALRRRDAIPHFSGTNLNAKTIPTALSGLEEKGIISRFEIRSAGRESFVYAPLSLILLVNFYIRYDFDRPEELSGLLQRFTASDLPIRSEAERYLLDLMPDQDR